MSYEYDAWGNCTVIYHGNGASTGAAANPFRYRGYYYDTDLGLYCVGTRYYDSNTGRWISPEPNLDKGKFDLNNTVLGYSVYIYCMNNPVINVDYTGEWTFSIGGFVTLVCFGGFSYGISISVDDDWNVGLQYTEANVFKKESGVVIGGINISAGGKASLSLDADTIYDLEGESFSVSGSYYIYGGEVATSDLEDVLGGVNSMSVSVAASPLPVDASVSASNTKTIGSFNAVNVYKKIKETIHSCFK